MDLSEIKIFHDGTSNGTFLFDKNNTPIGGISKVDISFDSMEQQLVVLIKMPKKDVNGEIIYNWDGTPVLKEIKANGSKVQLFDARLNMDEVVANIKMLEIYKKTVTPQTTFQNIVDNVIEKQV